MGRRRSGGCSRRRASFLHLLASVGSPPFVLEASIDPYRQCPNGWFRPSVVPSVSRDLRGVGSSVELDGLTGMSCSTAGHPETRPQESYPTVPVRRQERSIMGILRAVEWRSTRPVDETDVLIRSAMSAVAMEPDGRGGSIDAKSKRSLRKNRWAAEVSAEIAPYRSGSTVRWQVDMLGTKHFEILDEITDHLPEGVLDDRGIQAAVQRLGLHRVFGQSLVGKRFGTSTTSLPRTRMSWCWAKGNMAA